MIATLRNNHLPFAYVSISLFLSTSLNPLSYPPPPLLKNIWTKIWILDRELAFHLPSWLWRLKHFPSATWDVFEPLFLLVLLPFLFSWFVLPFHQFRLLPDVPVRIKLLHAFISFFLFFSLWLLFFFPSTCYFCSIPPPPYRARSDCKYPISVRISFNPLQRQDSTIVQVWMSNSKN